MADQTFEIDFKADDFRELYPKLYAKRNALKSDLYFYAAAFIGGLILGVVSYAKNYGQWHYFFALVLIVWPAEQVRKLLIDIKKEKLQRKQVEDIIVTNSKIKEHLLVFGNDGFKLVQDGAIGIYFKYMEIESIHASGLFLIVEKKSNNMAIPVKAFRGSDYQKVKEILNEKVTLNHY